MRRIRTRSNAPEIEVTKAMLQVDQLKIVFRQRQGRVTAVDDVSFAVDRGRIVGMVGESGCGKSVTCRALLRIEAPGRSAPGRQSCE